MQGRSITVSPRLAAAASMLEGSHCVADIGCDHGKLAVYLLQHSICDRVVASDISEDSLNKARRIAERLIPDGRMICRVGDGFGAISPGECDSAAVLGMGGTVMARLLSEHAPNKLGIRLIVLQPMRAQADIRSYLHQSGYHVLYDRIVRERERFYQVFLTEYRGFVQSLPEGWPIGFYDIGYCSLVQHDDNLLPLCMRLLGGVRARLHTAAGTAGEQPLAEKEKCIMDVIRLIKEDRR